MRWWCPENTSWKATFWAGGERCIQTGKMLHLLAGHSMTGRQRRQREGNCGGVRPPLMPIMRSGLWSRVVCSPMESTVSRLKRFWYIFSLKEQIWCQQIDWSIGSVLNNVSELQYTTCYFLAGMYRIMWKARYSLLQWLILTIGHLNLHCLVYEVAVKQAGRRHGSLAMGYCRSFFNEFQADKG